MKVDGNEFLRNVEIEQDKIRLMEEQKKLEELKRNSIKKEPDYFEDEDKNKDEDTAYVDLSFENAHEEDNENTINKLQDIMLEPDKTNKNKKKYLILIFSLILIFILTLVVIRMISNSDKERQLEQIKPQPQQIQKEKILDKIDSNKEFEEVIKKKQPVEEKLIIDEPEQIVKKEIILPDPVKDKPPVVIEKPQEPKREVKDLFGIQGESAKKEASEEQIQTTVNKLEKTVTQTAKSVKTTIQSTPQRKLVLPPAQETNFHKSDKKAISGYYIQVGAFTKKPSDKYLNNISKKGYKYTVYSMEIKGKMYNKVLIGGYPTKTLANKDLQKVKKDFNNPNAYILKF